ncbi:hypothetical protein BRC86_10385 [Halobacteriales archaeon QS_3_64_16]|nr:MAG: hypothetical protein BRC86_10385 [Halobacteriales archaeon QS_3_64_16]
MTLEDRLLEYVAYVEAGGDPYAPAHPLGNGEHDVWVSWRTDDGTTRLEIRVDDEHYGSFVDGKRIEPSWEGGVAGPEVTEWEDVRQL